MSDEKIEQHYKEFYGVMDLENSVKLSHNSTEAIEFALYVVNVESNSIDDEKLFKT